MPLPLNQWESTNLNDLVRMYVGPVHNDLDQLKIAKAEESNYIADYLNLNKDSNVLDLGSGLGYIAHNIAPKVGHLYCADISKTFLRETLHQIKDYNNVSCDLIKYGDLSKFKNLDAVYCMAVFIHFNLYDISIYLEEVYKTLKAGGSFLFDYYDIDHFQHNNERFIKHKERYKHDRQCVFTNINFNSTRAILNICKDIGFTIECKRNGDQPIMLAKKI